MNNLKTQTNYQENQQYQKANIRKLSTEIIKYS